MVWLINFLFIEMRNFGFVFFVFELRGNRPFNTRRIIYKLFAFVLCSRTLGSYFSDGETNFSFSFFRNGSHIEILLRKESAKNQLFIIWLGICTAFIPFIFIF